MENIKRSYKNRASTHQSAVASKIFELMDRKKTNLCASLDVRTTKELLDLADKVGPFVCLIKTHIDIIDDFEYTKTICGLEELAQKHDFFIFEDRKFADIGSTVKAQYCGGIFKIAKWSHISNAHGVTGAGVVDGLREAAQETTSEPRGLLMLAELSSKGALATGEYTKGTVAIAKANADFVCGFIAQNRMPEDEGQDWIIMTPGVGLDDKGDGLGQQYRPVDQVIENGSDVIIVGRGLYGKGRDVVAEAQRYRKAGWEAYEKRINY